MRHVVTELNDAWYILLCTDAAFQRNREQYRDLQEQLGCVQQGGGEKEHSGTLKHIQI